MLVAVGAAATLVVCGAVVVVPAVTEPGSPLPMIRAHDDGFDDSTDPSL